MKKLGLLLSILFAVSTVTLGTVYSNKKQEKLSSSVTSNSVLSKKNNENMEENLKKDRGNIVYSPMGDSLTDGFFASTDEKRFAKVYASLLEDNLGFKVDTKGVSGYGGISGNGVEGLTKIKEQQPDLVTIEYGTNDSDPQNGSSLDQFKTNITQIIEELQSMDKAPKIVLVTTWNQGDKAKPFDNFIKEIGKAKNIPVADISSIWADSETKGPAGKETFKGESDNWHPNDEGMSRIAQEIYDVSYETLIK